MKLWVWQLNEDRKSYSATNYRMPQWGQVYDEWHQDPGIWLSPRDAHDLVGEKVEYPLLAEVTITTRKGVLSRKVRVLEPPKEDA
jgi:hypothetical protein